MKDVSRASAYATLLPSLMIAGRELGYAIAVHGSMATDLDLVAIPWTEDAASAEHLILHLMAAVDGRLRNASRRKEDGEWERMPASIPTDKPHGRRAWTIHIGCEGMYLDVSVMPRSPG